MAGKLVPLVAAVLLAAHSTAALQPRSLRSVRPRIARRDLVDLSALPQPQYFTQDQDHFDGTNTNTWQQAYYVNDTFWSPGSDAPVFVCVGGEGPPLDGSVVVASVHCNVAVELLPKTGALMVALEHRYYGCHNMDACPVKTLQSTADLKFLSSRQALADLAAFHAHITSRFGLSSRNKWISFGGSYPGMLASWFRLRFPHLVHGSISSSAPVRAKVDMHEYNDLVAMAYTVSDNNVGGSQNCHDAIQIGHATIGNLFQSNSGRSRLAQLFGRDADWYAQASNQLAFAGEGVAYFPAQGNDPTCTESACNIARICQVMTNSSIGDAVARLAEVRRLQESWLVFDEEPTPSNELDYWGYQTCTEFAFYQTCEVGSRCFFTQGLATLATQEDFCVSTFGIPTDKVARNVNYTNVYYGADKPAGSCVLYVNGEVDPWRGLSINKAPSPNLQTLFVPGASHHAWTHPSSPADQVSVKMAREEIRSTVSDFLNQPCDQPSSFW
eukprot:m.12573 g.12573  ORF g.12573 m.12573 type:complete len:498 (-) comp3244_c0_seq2:128-1621(-)